MSEESNIDNTVTHDLQDPDTHAAHALKAQHHHPIGSFTQEQQHSRWGVEAHLIVVAPKRWPLNV